MPLKVTPSASGTNYNTAFFPPTMGYKYKLNKVCSCQSPSDGQASNTTHIQLGIPLITHN